MSYFCKRCGYNTERKSSLKNHFLKSNTCKPKVSDIRCCDMLKILNKNDMDFFKTLDTERLCYICHNCYKEFSHKTNLTRHLKNNCKAVKEKCEDTRLQGNINITNNTDNSTNNTNNGSIHNGDNNNIVINCFGNENIDYLNNPKVIDKLLTGTIYECLTNIIRQKHFNKKHPENNNIKIRSAKDKYGLIKMNNEWIFMFNNDISKEVAFNVNLLLIDYLNNPEIKEHRRKKIPIISNKVHEEDKELLDYVKLGMINGTRHIES